MRKRRADTEGLCNALNAMGIKTSIAGGNGTKDNLLSRALRDTENARLQAMKEIARISGKAKRSTSR